MKQYRVEHGLPSDIVKASIQDSLGYFWIATDEGLVKYDGIRFTHYRENFQSNFMKGFYTTHDGKLLVFGDLDFYQIRNKEDTVIFQKLCAVSRTASDTSLSYPKLIFEDSKNRIWISESQAVVRFNFGSIKRYDFDLNNRTPQFLRSFSFFEDKQNSLYVNSFQGNIFKYKEDQDKFELMDVKFPYGIEHILVMDSILIIGSSDGIYQTKLLSSGGFALPVLLKKIHLVSQLSLIGPNRLLVTTREDQHYVYDMKKATFSMLPFSIYNLNHVYVSKEEDIWLSGNEGLIMMRENIFQKVNPDVTDFIESITEDITNHSIFYATNTTLYSLDRESGKNSSILTIPSGYFQSLQYSKEGIWVANAFKVFLFQNGNILNEFDFSGQKRFVTALSKDANNNIWLSIPGLDEAYVIDQNKSLKKFDVPLGQNAAINTIKAGKNGIYIASSGKDKYLLFKSYTDAEFKNISAPLNIPVQSDFNVSDIAIQGETLWLATSHGLMKFVDSSITQINYHDRFSNLPIKSIYCLNDEKLLIANAYGLIIYNVKTGAFELYNESTGLPSNTIPSKGLYVSKDSTIWIGTAKGLCYNKNSLFINSKTPSPRFTNILINGQRISSKSEKSISFNSYLSIELSSITFPESEVYFKYRILPDDNWKVASRNQINMITENSGDFTLQAKAKKNGPYAWSELSTLHYNVTQPYWEKGWFYLAMMVTILLLIGTTSYGMNAINKKRNQRLQNLVEERTEELREMNEKLLRLNNEKNNLIGIVAHDLKSPLQQVKGLISIINMTGNLDKESSENLHRIEHSATRMNELILKILDVNAIESEKSIINLKRIDVSSTLKSVVNQFKSRADKKHINLLKNIEKNQFALGDQHFMEQVFDNLLSNAIKFSPFHKSVSISLTTIQNEIICEVRDEGPGINEEDMKNLFGKYQRLSAKPTGNEISTGLGLMIAKKFTEEMDGKIWCESVVGKGTSFFVSFRCN